MKYLPLDNKQPSNQSIILYHIRNSGMSFLCLRCCSYHCFTLS